MYYYFGKTCDEAIEAGLKELGVTEKEVIITRFNEGTKGVFGIGGKKAKVGLELKAEEGKRAVEFLEGIFEFLNVPVSADLSEDDDKILINLITTSSATLIGYRGEMLDALQTLAGAVANIGRDEYKRLVVDCEGYRQKREETLKGLAERLAQKAIKSGRKVTLEPMNPFERRIIHSALSENENVKTESVGSEPNRYIVIIPNNLKPYEKKKGDYKNRDKKDNKGGFKSEMIKTTKKTSGFGTYLGNSLKD